MGLTNCAFTTGYVEEMPYEDGSFDVVLMEDVLEHVSEPRRALLECVRVLRGNGILIARFPSIRMLHAHHFDRAISLPGLHYLLPFRTWAAGLNHYLLHYHRGPPFEPFGKVRATPFHRGVTNNLNGLRLASFRALVAETPLHVRHLGLVPVARGRFRGRLAPLYPVYALLWRLPVVREILSRAILFIGEKPHSIGAQGESVRAEYGAGA
jgi:SAM-dependent methyltransferase